MSPIARTRDLWYATRDGQRAPTARHGHGKRWLAIWTAPDGAEATKAFSRRTDAQLHASTQETDAARGTYVTQRAARTTVAEWSATWLAGYATRRPSTVAAARVHLAKIGEEFGTLPLSAVRPSHIKAWTARLRADGLSVSYVHRLHTRLAQLLGDAVNDGLLPRSPCSRRTSPGQGRQRPYVATTGQVWALYDAMPPYLAAGVLLGAFAGLRTAEACGLRTSDVDFMRGVIHPAVQYPAEELKTEISKTSIPIPQSLALQLSAHVAQHPGPWLLVNPDGTQVGWWKIERAVRLARPRIPGLPAGFRFHDLRHYFASLLIASGADVKTVQARLRHASAKTTIDTYTHLWPDRDESTRAAVEAVFQARAEQERNKEATR